MVSANRVIARRRQVRSFHASTTRPSLATATMVRNPITTNTAWRPNELRQNWRRKADLSRLALAEAIITTPMVISPAQIAMIAVEVVCPAPTAA